MKALIVLNFLMLKKRPSDIFFQKTVESLGLGTCMIGSVHPLIQYGKRAKKFREKYGIKHKSREGVFIIFGYPTVKYKSGIKRTFASTTFTD